MMVPLCKNMRLEASNYSHTVNNVATLSLKLSHFNQRKKKLGSQIYLGLSI